MGFYNRNDGLFFVDPPILANTGADINVATGNVTMTNQYISPNSDLKIAVPAGLFVAETTPGNFRYLPRTTNQALVTSGSSTTVTLSPYNVFVAGDTLSVVEPYTVLTISAVSVSQTVTVTVNGVTSTTTADTSVTTTTASEVAANINATPLLSYYVFAIANANTVYLYAKDGITLYTVNVGGTATASLSASAMAFNNTAIGTISSINYITGVATLTGTATATVPIGAHLGMTVLNILGLDIHARDFTIIQRQNISLYSRAVAVRTQFLPYYDGDIERRFRGLIKFGQKF